MRYYFVGLITLALATIIIFFLSFNNKIRRLDKTSHDKKKLKQSHITSITSNDSKTKDYSQINTTEPYQIFEKWNYSFPCYPRNKYVGYGKTLKGLIYVKIPKTASSTMSGVALRIGHRHFKNESAVPKMTFCGTAWCHTKARQHQILKRDETTSFLWTILREPTNRVLSSFYFHNRRKSNDYSYSKFKKYM